MCAARWLTPYSGLPRARAYAFAAQTPTSSAPVSPGPAVTAMASTSARVTPAVASARSTAGTIASRCARLATSGTTPPNRACSATLDATARDGPGPCGPLGALQDPPHDQGVGTRWLVIAAPEPDIGEPVATVEVLRPRIVHPDLQENLFAATPRGLGEQPAEQGGADPLPPAVLRHGHCQHVRLAAAGGEQAGVADHSRPVLGHQVVTAVRDPREFGGQHALRPCLRAEQGGFQAQHGRQIAAGHGTQRSTHDGVTRFGGPGAWASGLRRYNGSAGSIGSCSASRRAANWASVPAAGYSGPIRSPSSPG